MPDSDVAEKEAAEMAEGSRPAGEYDPDQILRDAARLYERKNEAYGNAWQLTGKTMALWCDEMGVDVLEIAADPETFVSLFLYMHRLEKLIRAFNGEFLVEGELDFESIADSHRDAGPYSAMHASLLEGGL